MKIYMGKNSLKRLPASLDKETVLYKGKDVLIASDAPPFIKMPLGEGRMLLIWGRIYGVRHPDGTIHKFDPSKGEDPLLKELASKGNVNNIIKNLEGHFAGALVRSEGDIAVFADVYNRRDIFYCLKGDSLVASTDLKAVVGAYPPKRYDQEALVSMFYVYGNYSPKKHTIYEGIYRLGVGESIEYKEGKVGIKLFRFKPVPTQEYKDEQLDEYSDLVHSAVDIRSSAEGNWISLSSGWDSSSILALLVKLYGPSKIRAVTSRCKYSFTNGIVNQFEIDRAKKIADYFSVPLDIVDVDYTKQEYLDFWQEIRGSLKANHLYSLWNYDYLRLAQHISKNGQPAQSFFNGEISDGAHNIGFAQQATILDHPDLNFREYSDKMMAYLFGPSFFSRIMKGEANKDVVYNFFKSRMSDSVFDDSATMDDKQRKARFIESFFIATQRVPFISLSNTQLLTSDGRQKYRSVMRDAYFADFVEKGTPESVYSWFLHLYNSFHWQGSTVKGVSHSTDYYGKDLCLPFWDSRIQSFLSAMPESWGRGLDFNRTKYPLKWMLKNKVDYPHHLQAGPHSYLYDIDPNWSADADILYGSVGKPYFKELIRKYQFEEILQSSHFNLDYLRKLTDDYVNDKKVSGQERTDLKNLISLSLIGWYPLEKSEF